MADATLPTGPVLVIAGPTGVGKTDIAMAVADRLPSSLISMDSALVYRQMNIGTAKPSPEALAAYPHRLIDIRDPAQAYSAAEFLRDADAAVREARNAGRLPVLVGGTMLYLRAFRDGLAMLPAATEAVRAAIRNEAAERGWPALHAQLVDVDPLAAANIHPHNSQRLQRALEVYRVSGRPISEYWRQQTDAAFAHRLGGSLVECAVLPDRRALLHRRLEARFAQMLAEGLVDEVRALRARGDLNPALPSMRAVGYRQVWEHLDGHYPFAELAERGVAATRQLAKRQLTWLRRWPWLVGLTWAPAERVADRIVGLVDGAR